MNVFVYGSLKKGYWNNSLLRDSEFLYNATTSESKFDMLDLGSFPAVVDGGLKINGEVYKVNRRTLEMLDALEGNGSFYNREEVLVNSDGGDNLAWIYIFCGTGGGSRGRNLHLENNTISWRVVV